MAKKAKSNVEKVEPLLTLADLVTYDEPELEAPMGAGDDVLAPVGVEVPADFLAALEELVEEQVEEAGDQVASLMVTCVKNPFKKLKVKIEELTLLWPAGVALVTKNQKGRYRFTVVSSVTGAAVGSVVDLVDVQTGRRIGSEKVLHAVEFGGGAVIDATVAGFRGVPWEAV